MALPVTIQGVSTHAIIDTAAQVSIINEGLAKQISPPLKTAEKVLLMGAGKSSNMIASRMPKIPIEIGGIKYTCDILVAPIIMIIDDFILGLDFLKENNAQIDLNCDTVNLMGHTIYADTRRNRDSSYTTQRVVLTKKVVVPPNSIASAEVQFTGNLNKAYIIHAPEQDHKGLNIPYSLVTSNDDTSTRHQATNKGPFIEMRTTVTNLYTLKRDTSLAEQKKSIQSFQTVTKIHLSQVTTAVRGTPLNTI